MEVSVLKRLLIQSMELRCKSGDTEVRFFRFVDKFHRGQQRILDIHKLVTRPTHFLFGDREKNMSIVEFCQRFFQPLGPYYRDGRTHGYRYHGQWCSCESCRDGEALLAYSYGQDVYGASGTAGGYNSCG